MLRKFHEYQIVTRIPSSVLRRARKVKLLIDENSVEDMLTTGTKHIGDDILLVNSLLSDDKIDFKNRGWRICIVYPNEGISGIWRTNDAMSSLRSA